MVLHRKRVCGCDCYLIEQPDHTLTYLPVWMTDAQWREVVIRPAPRLPPASLEELSGLLRAAVSSLASTSCDEGNRHAATRTVRTAQGSRIFIPETIETQLIELLAQLMLSTLHAAAGPDEEMSDEPIQR